jgi:non-ribosomal peptide synthetase component F
MCSTAVHRLIEQQAAASGDRPALIDETRSLSYRELNQRANAVARALFLHGFRRGHVAVVNMPKTMDLAVVCLGVLKAGGAYTWIDDDPQWPEGVSFAQGAADDEVPYVAIDLRSVLTAAPAQAPNLPIVTRGSDTACVINGAGGEPPMLVPHGTIMALQRETLERVAWSDDLLNVWIGLMGGAAVTLAPTAALSAA